MRGEESAAERPTLSQPTRVLILILACLTALACGSRRPEFAPEMAVEQLSAAFELPADEVSVLNEEKPPQLEGESDAEYRARAEVWVDFKVPSFRETLQARFVGGDEDWQLDGVRRRPRSNRLVPWSEVGAMLGEVRASASEKTERSMAIMRELGSAVEAQAVDNGNVFATTDIKGLARLLTRGRYLEKWNHAKDGWGNAIHYYSSSEGDAYVLVSRGADNRFDLPVDAYNAKTDAGDFTYEGAHSDPSLDLIYATGSFVQVYVPSE
jgi:hypothetical protein